MSDTWESTERTYRAETIVFGAVAVAVIAAIVAIIFIVNITNEHRANHFHPGACGEVVTHRTKQGYYTSKMECAKP